MGTRARQSALTMLAVDYNSLLVTICMSYSHPCHQSLDSSISEVSCHHIQCSEVSTRATSHPVISEQLWSHLHPVGSISQQHQSAEGATSWQLPVGSPVHISEVIRFIVIIIISKHSLILLLLHLLLLLNILLLCRWCSHLLI